MAQIITAKHLNRTVSKEDIIPTIYSEKNKRDFIQPVREQIIKPKKSKQSKQ